MNFFIHYDTHQCQSIAEIYYFKPVRSRTSMSTLCALNIIVTANGFSVIDVPCSRILCPGRLHGDFYSSPRIPALPEPCKAIYPRPLLYSKYLSQGPFNKKENAFIVIMASASANSALGTEVLAVQRSVTITHIDGIYLSLLKIVLQHHAQSRCFDFPALLFSTSWVRECFFKFKRALTKFLVMELVA